MVDAPRPGDRVPNELLVPSDAKIRLYRIDDAPLPAPFAAPACGADTDALLAEAGYGADEIAALRRAGAAA